MITKISTNNATVKILSTEKFTRDLVTVNLITPLGEDASFNALLAGVMRQGNETYRTQNDLNRFLDENYGAGLSVSVSKKGENQIVRFSVSFIADKYALNGEPVSQNMLGFLRDFIGKPYWTEERIAIEKQNLIDQIKSRINNKRQYALYRLSQEMCKEEAYGVDEYGRPEVIETITSAQLQKQYGDLMRHATVLVSCIGRTPEKEIMDFTESLFCFAREPVCGNTLYVEEAEDVTETVEELDVNQSILAMGYRIGSKGYNDHMFSYLLLNSIFGGSPNSFLFMNVREKLSLCYFCSSVTERMKGIMLVYAGISAENKQKAFDEIEKQRSRLQAGDFSDEDMAAAFKDVSNQFEQITDELFALDNYYLSCFIGKNDMGIEEVLAGLKAVTREDIVNAAKLVTLDTVYFLKERTKG